MMRRLLFIPILLVSVAAVALLVALGPEPEAQEIETRPPEVLVETVRLGVQRVVIAADGTARPARRTTVAAQATGEVIWAADGLEVGARVAEGAPLFRTRPGAYEEALAAARSRLAEAELRVLREEASADLARTEWDQSEPEPDPLALRVPQLAAAAEAVAAARSAVHRAEEDLASTEVRAPHAGLVSSRDAEVGEWVTPGMQLAELLSLDVSEVRVSLPDAALALVDLPFPGRAERGPAARVTATLGPPTAAVRWSWEGRLTRMEGEVDPATRFFPAVIEVPHPYQQTADGRPPLIAGMFVQAQIEGREFPDVAVVPRSAFRADGTVLVVDDTDRVRVREVDAFWSRADGALLVRSGLRDGERFVISPPLLVAGGMRVRVADGPATRPAGGRAPGADP